MDCLSTEFDRSGPPGAAQGNDRSVARERWQANRQTAHRHDVPDDLFTQAVDLMEPPDEMESVMRYDGVAPVAAWVAAWWRRCPDAPSARKVGEQLG